LDERLSVGFLGAGPVTQAIHLPSLASMPDRFVVSAVMDIDADVAERIASRCGARATVSASDVISDPAIDVVAICSPNAIHAEQLIACARAGKKAVLCEKPLAIDEDQVSAIEAAMAHSNMAIVVGTMHAYDPAYRSGYDLWKSRNDPVRTIRSSIFLPGNDEFVALSTDQFPPPKPFTPPPPPPEAVRLRNTILGLAIHNLPLIRQYCPTIDDVLSARHVPGFGYSILLRSGETLIDLQALMPGAWEAEWTLEIDGATTSLDARFTPSYVQAGSAKVSVHDAHSSTRFSESTNGYQAQWSHLSDIVRGRLDPLVPMKDALHDVRYALQLADAAARFLEIAA
jgi:myo-inositol 2-dehydrogenase / D-chiro-inositol 1-dehydrogenase